MKFDLSDFLINNSSTKSGKILKFTCDAPVSNGEFLDLWQNSPYRK